MLSRTLKRFAGFLCCFSMLYLSAGPLQGQGAGHLAAPILRISPNARQVGMGDAYTAVVDSANFLRYNVGGLGISRHVVLSTNFHKWIDDTYQGNFEVTIPWRFGVASFGLTYFSEGELTEINENFQPTGVTSTNNNLMLSFGYGAFLNLFGQTLSFGAGGKFIRQDLAGFSASGVGLDVGALFALNHLSFGATFQNFTVSKLKFKTVEELLPETIRGGVALQLNLGPELRWRVASDVAKIRDEKDLRIYTGTELRISDLISFRGGYKIHDTELSRWSAGMGLVIPMEWLANSYTELDYAFAPMDAFDTFAHRFSLTFTFGVVQQVQAINQIDTEQITKLQDELNKELEAAQEARKRAEEAEARTRELEAEMARRLEHIQQIALTSAGKIEVIPDRTDSSLIHVSLRINFDFDKADIRPSEFGTMDKIAEILNTYPEAKLWIAGHTDSIGSEEYNIHLSQRRMDSVMNHLSVKGNVNPDRFFMPVAYGESRPIEDNGTDAGRARNRRVDFTIFTRDSQPGIPEGSAIKSIQALSDTAFAILCNGAIPFDPDNMEELSGPPRLVLDFPGIFDLSTQKNFPINRGLVRSARIGYHRQFKFTRVVFDLMRPGEYAAKAVDNSVVVYVR